MIKTTFSYNEKEKLKKKLILGVDFPLVLKSFEYDKFGKKIKINQYNQDGDLETTSTFFIMMMN